MAAYATDITTIKNTHLWFPLPVKYPLSIRLEMTFLLQETQE